ncbi:MAG: type IV secretion system DNA-binding domain-containing protein [Alphaproteobacteria bacterium]|nr:type IV secretion system DNA-binding domain-containing protein [Alphaproteobacteria bacterium]
MAKRISPSIHRPRSPGIFSRNQALQSRNQTETQSLYVELQNAILRSTYAQENARDQLVTQLVEAGLAANPFPTVVRQAFQTAATTLIGTELSHLYEVPPLQPEANQLALYENRKRIRAQLDFLVDEQNLISAWHRQLLDVFAKLGSGLPRYELHPAGLTISVPLIAQLPDPTSFIDDLVRRLTSLATHPAGRTHFPGYHLSQIIITNLLTASRLTLEEARNRPYRITWPIDAKLSVADLIDTYLSGTPFAALLKTEATIVVPNNLRTEHFIATATIGFGKTQLMQSIVLNDLDDPNRPSTVIIDSQGDAISALSRLKRFDPAIDDRLILIDPTDRSPPALNLFHYDREYADTLDERDREEFLAGIIELFEFVAGGLLGAELTPRMSVTFRYLAQLLIQIPDATIGTLIGLLQDPEPYFQYFDRMTPTARNFIEEIFKANSQYRQTREHILQRLFHVLSNPAFERMFAHPRNKLDLRAALNGGKVVLINTAKAQLKAEWSAIFGRYFVALIMQAAFARAFIPREQRRLALIHLDEASEYLDPNIDQLLIQGRKYAIALHLYHQTMDQMNKKELRATALAIPALRFTGSLNDADANLLAKEMNTTPEFLKSVSKTRQGADWIAYIRNLTPTAVKFKVPFLQAEREPKMSEDAYQLLLERNRQNVSAPPQTHTHPGDRKPPTNNGDEY